MIGDMILRRQMGMAKVRKAIAEHGGTTLMSAGLTSIVAGILGKAAAEAGARIFEISPNGIALDLGLEGVSSRPQARRMSYRVPIEDICRRVAGFRAVLGDEVFITVSMAGLWTYLSPCPFTDREAYLLATAGADCLHVHKVTLEDHANIVEVAHQNGILVEAYIADPEEPDPASHYGFLGVPAANPEEVAKCVREMEGVGVDLMGLVTGKTYQGLKSNEITPKERERIEALVQTATQPTILEGGITPANCHAYKATGVNIIVVGTAFDQVCQNCIRDTVKELLC
jgi:cyclase